MASGGKFHVKNRAPAPIQISAEQILREARDRSVDVEIKAPRQQITDAEELNVFRSRKRKEFEDAIRGQREFIGTWMKYASWEESQLEFTRARSVYERALDVDHKNRGTWLKYAEMEMRNKFVNHARNIWDRATTLLPRVDQFWYKYAYMEEMVGEIGKARAIFERWMEWEPDVNGWGAYIMFEMRQEEVGLARKVMERYVNCIPSTASFLKWARWEEKQGQKQLARQVYEKALTELNEEERTEKLFISFAKFEERCKEIDRARVIYKFSLDQSSKDQVPLLYKEFISFEKRHGSQQGIEEVIVNKRRVQYEEEVAKEPSDYDSWFDYIRLEEAEGDLDKIREVYERAIANVPPVEEKRFWRRYIYLWINYALFEELQAEDMERTREVYKAALSVVPHKAFTFAKLWIMLAHFEVRQRDLQAARKVLGQAIGQCKKEKLFKKYIELELQLGEVDRCRMLYSKYLEAMPYNCTAWANFAQLESSVGELERARAVFELAIEQEELDMPEALWKAYIDFEIKSGEADRARELYKRLLDKTQHVKVWTSYAKFEQLSGDGMAAARDVYTAGYAELKRQGLRDERVVLLEDWRNAEKSVAQADGGEGLKKVTAMLPRRFKKKRMLTSDSGEDMGWEEYYDYQFPDDEKAPANLKILEMAQKWKSGGGMGAMLANAKKRKAQEMGESGGEGGGGGGGGGGGREEEKGGEDGEGKEDEEGDEDEGREEEKGGEGRKDMDDDQED